MEYLSISLSHFQIPSSTFYSFAEHSSSTSLVKFIPRYFILFDAILKLQFSCSFFLIVNYKCIEKQHISVYWFCTLKFYWIHLLFLIDFWWRLQGFLYIVLCHLQIVTVLLLLFKFGCVLFLFLVKLLWLELQTMLTRSSESVHLCLVLRFKGKVTVEHYFSCGFLINGLYYVEIYSLYTSFDESFYHGWMVNFVNWFFCIYLDDHMSFILCFVHVAYHIGWFTYVEPSLWPRNEYNLIMVYNHLYILLDLLC